MLCAYYSFRQRPKTHFRMLAIHLLRPLLLVFSLNIKLFSVATIAGAPSLPSKPFSVREITEHFLLSLIFHSFWGDGRGSQHQAGHIVYTTGLCWRAHTHTTSPVEKPLKF